MATIPVLEPIHYRAADIRENLGNVISVSINENVVGVSGYCLAWCKECSDGVNATRSECDYWVVEHASKRHSMRIA